jgi:hypothetical protein
MLWRFLRCLYLTKSENLNKKYNLWVDFWVNSKINKVGMSSFRVVKAREMNTIMEWIVMEGSKVVKK